MKKTLWAIIVIIILILIAFGLSKKDTEREAVKSESEPINVGVLMPLSGTAAYYGEQAKKGVDLAKKVLAEKYPNLAVNVIYEDNMFTPKGSIDAYTKVKTANKIDAVITGTTPSALAVAPLAKQDNILMMAAFAVADAYSSPNDLTFRVSTKGATESSYLVSFVKDQGYKKAAVIYLNNDYGVSQKTSIIEELKKINVAYSEEAYMPDATDFRSMLLKVKQFNPDAVFTIGVAKSIGVILKQAKDIGLNAQFMGIRAMQDPVLLTNADAAEGVVYTYPFDANGNAPEIVSFTENFKKDYGAEPDSYGAEGYEAMRFVIESFANCGKDNDCIKNYLTGLKQTPSIFGPLSFDENGDVMYSFFFKTVKDGKFVKYEE